MKSARIGLKRTKRCPRCGEEKSITEFYGKRSKTGYCKPCNIDYNIEAGPRYLVNMARSRAKARGLPFDLTPSDITIPVFCPVLGLKLERGAFGWKGNDAAPSIDRIIPELGYTKGNVVVVSNKANRMKSNGTAEELRRVARFYTQLEKERWTHTKRNGANISARNTASRSRSTSAKKATSARSSWTPKKKWTAPLKANSPVLLIDGDMFAYRAAFGTEEAYMCDDHTMSYKCDLEEAYLKAEEMIDEVASELKAEKIIVCLSHEDNFRQALYPDYKMNRINNRKPLALNAVKRWMTENYETKIKPGLEADDVIGILATHPTLLKGKKIVVSGDKDMMQIPGRHYNHLTKEKRVVSEPEANYAFFTQVLTGDATDNFPGCPGIGPKRAAGIFNNACHGSETRGSTPKQLQEAMDAKQWAAVVAAFEKAGLTAEDALLQARIARILRHTDYNFKKKEPILWTP